MITFKTQFCHRQVYILNCFLVVFHILVVRVGVKGCGTLSSSYDGKVKERIKAAASA